MSDKKNYCVTLNLTVEVYVEEASSKEEATSRAEAALPDNLQLNVMDSYTCEANPIYAREHRATSKYVSEVRD